MELGLNMHFETKQFKTYINKKPATWWVFLFLPTFETPNTLLNNYRSPEGKIFPSSIFWNTSVFIRVVWRPAAGVFYAKNYGRI